MFSLGGVRSGIGGIERRETLKSPRNSKQADEAETDGHQIVYIIKVRRFGCLYCNGAPIECTRCQDTNPS